MAYTTINKSTDHFNTKLYTGNGSTQSITGVGFQPDWLWIKNRSGTNDHILQDVVRGATKSLESNGTSAETTSSTRVTSFDSDGFSVGSAGTNNTNSSNYVSWNWKAANSQGSSNTDGSINTTYTSANTTAGFSISQYVGTGSNATIGHGLGAVPKWIIVKNLSASGNSWCVYHSGIGNTAAAFLEGTVVPHAHVDYWNNTSPTSSVFYIGAGTGTNGNGNNLIAYCFAEKTGYSKFGSYTANGNADGNFIYTGFAPKFIILKRTDTSGYNWIMMDDKSNTYNPWTNLLLPNLNNAEITSGGATDFLSNGFKLRSASGANPTTNQGTIIYMAFGQSLVGSNNVPCTAR